MPPLGAGFGGREHAVDRHHRRDVGALAREIEHIGAAVAVADRGAALGVADAALAGLGGHGLERADNGAARAGDVLDERRQELHRVLGALRAFAVAEHVGHEHDIAVARVLLRDGNVLRHHAAPVRRDQQQRLALLALVVDQLALVARAADRIFHRFAFHRRLPSLTLLRPQECEIAALVGAQDLLRVELGVAARRLLRIGMHRRDALFSSASRPAARCAAPSPTAGCGRRCARARADRRTRRPASHAARWCRRRCRSCARRRRGPCP